MFDNLIRKFVNRKNELYANDHINKYDESINELEKLTKKLNEKDKELKEHFRLIELENDILKLITKGKDFNYIFYKITEAIEYFDEETSNIFVSILYYDENKNKLFNLCSPNLSRGCLELVENGIPLTKNTLSCGVAACKKEIIKVNDVQNSTFCANKFPQIREEAINNNIKACHSAPIIGNNDKLLGTISIYFKDESYTDEIYEKLLCWAVKIASIILEKKYSEESLDQNIKEIKEKNNLLESIIDASGGYLWKKDSKDRYQFSDFYYHFNLLWQKDKNNVIGKTDNELDSEFRYKFNNKINQYYEISMITDEYTKKIKEQTRFIAGGYIYDDLSIFEIIKTPLFDMFGNYKGIVGFLWDRSEEMDLVFKDVNLLKEEDRVKFLNELEYPDTPFVYYIIPNKKYYRKLISKPIYDDPTIIDKRLFVENHLNGCKENSQNT